MALPNVTSWFRWSNTSQEWGERLGTLSVVAAALLLWYLAAAAPLWLQVTCWATLGLLLAFFWRRGWVRLCGPVLFYDLLRIGRRSRLFVYRLVYLGMLLFLLGLVYLNWKAEHRFNVQALRNQEAELSLRFFITFMAVQLLVVVVLTPAFTAGAITEEKERKTLEFILATDLRNREIIFGKLLSRMALLGLFILTGLPILSALQFMGGFSPRGLLAGFAMTLLTMMSLASLSVFVSVLTRRTRDALFVVYIIVLGYLGASVVADYLLNEIGWKLPSSTATWSSPPTVEDLLFAVRWGNPVFTVQSLITVKGFNEDGLNAALAKYALFHGLVALLSIGGALGLLRWAVLGEIRSARTREIQSRGHPSVGRWPMVWKEVGRKKTGKRRWLIVTGLLVLVLLSFLPVGSMFVSYYERKALKDASNHYWRGNYRDAVSNHGRGYYPDPWYELGQEVNQWVRIVGPLVAFLGIAGVGIKAATTVRGEHDKDTMASLLTTPLTCNEILFAKWLASVLSMRWIALWLGLIWCLAVALSALSPLVVPLLALATLSYAAAAASIGLWCSVVFRTSLRAILCTLLLGFLLTIGHWIPWLGFLALGERPSEELKAIAQLQGALTPPVVLARYLPLSSQDLIADLGNHNLWNPRMLIFLSFGGALASILLALLFWFHAIARFKRVGGRTDSVLKRKARAQPIAALLG